jgi:hypothetical protein
MHFFMARDKKKVVFYGPRKIKFGHHYSIVYTECAILIYRILKFIFCNFGWFYLALINNKDKIKSQVFHYVLIIN